MSMAELLRDLKRIRRRKELVEVDRSPLADAYMKGYVVGVSDSLVMFHVVDDDCYFNGYCVYALESIARTRLEWEEGSLHRALTLRGERPVELPGIVLAGWKEVILSVKELYPLVLIDCEKIDNTVCWIGQVRRVSSDAVTIREIEPSAKWSGLRKFKYEDITGVEWGGGYVDALWAVAQDDKKQARARSRKRGKSETV